VEKAGLTSLCGTPHFAQYSSRLLNIMFLGSNVPVSPQEQVNVNDPKYILSSVGSGFATNCFRSSALGNLITLLIIVPSDCSRNIYR
jgi:hypothetical protein